MLDFRNELSTDVDWDVLLIQELHGPGEAYVRMLGGHLVIASENWSRKRTGILVHKRNILKLESVSHEGGVLSALMTLGTLKYQLVSVHIDPTSGDGENLAWELDTVESLLVQDRILIMGGDFNSELHTFGSLNHVGPLCKPHIAHAVFNRALAL